LTGHYRTIALARTVAVMRCEECHVGATGNRTDAGVTRRA
jgi:hypothetical protein